MEPEIGSASPAFSMNAQTYNAFTGGKKYSTPNLSKDPG